MGVETAASAEGRTGEARPALTAEERDGEERPAFGAEKRLALGAVERPAGMGSPRFSY